MLQIVSDVTRLLEAIQQGKTQAAEDPTSADLVKLRYFVGMTMEEAAVALGLSLRTAERLWAYARAWLRRRISSGL